MCGRKTKADGKESSVPDWISLMGNDKKLLLYHLPEKNARLFEA